MSRLSRIRKEWIGRCCRVLKGKRKESGLSLTRVCAALSFLYYILQMLVSFKSVFGLAFWYNQCSPLNLLLNRMGSELLTNTHESKEKIV